jgi:hypothetical protein
MPIDTTGYRQFSIGLGVGAVANPRALDIRVDPASNNGANILSIYTGTLILSAQGTFPDWRRGNLVARVPTGGRRWTSTSLAGTAERPGFTFLSNATVVLSLASIFNAGEANNAGWAVDSAQVEVARDPTATSQPDDHLEIQALLAVRDSDGFLFRLSYQVTALGTQRS